MPLPASLCFFLLFFSFSPLAFSVASDDDVAGDPFLLLPAFPVDPTLHFENPRLRQAYIALQTWKSALFSDPQDFTSNWHGSDVCSYNGIFCAPSPYDSLRVVAGIDLNHADIAGNLPPELGLLSDLALFHLNSNRFCGVVPASFGRMKLLHELDLSNNRFAGKFPHVVLSLPSLKYIDLRFNEFEGPVPSGLFDKNLDAIFLNDNRFRLGIPDNIGNSPISVLVFANNDLGGCIPASIGKMGKTLNEIILLNDNLTGCLPPQIGELNSVTVFDVSFNHLQGPLPMEVGEMQSLELLDIAHNKFTGVIPASVCELPSLQNFTYSFNYFTGEAPSCAALGAGKATLDGSKNCIDGKADQRSSTECSSDDARPVDCTKLKGCGGVSGGSDGRGSPPSKPRKKRPVERHPAPTGAHSPRPFVRPSHPPPPASESSPTLHPPPPPPQPPASESSPTLHPPPPPASESSPTLHSPPPPTSESSPTLHPPPTPTQLTPPHKVFYVPPPAPAKKHSRASPPPVKEYTPPPAPPSQLHPPPPPSGCTDEEPSRPSPPKSEVKDHQSTPEAPRPKEDYLLTPPQGSDPTTLPPVRGVSYASPPPPLIPYY